MSPPESSAPSNPYTSATASVEIVPGGRVDGRVRPPGSKSLTNRALICAAFADGPSTLTGALRSEDTEVMIAALRQIGIGIELSDAGQAIAVRPNLDRNHQTEEASDPVELFIANSGTTVRFLTAALSAISIHARLLGVSRMHQRPIGDLVNALATVMDGSIKAESDGGCPPVTIYSRGWSGHSISVAGNVSSQYLSGLMMAARIALSHATPTGTKSSLQVDGNSLNQEPIEIRVQGELVSRPYVEMTASVMRALQANVELVDQPDALLVRIEPGPYQGIQYGIEPDASAASYFWATAAISGGEVTVEGLSALAMQGDVGFVDVLEKMGCEVRRENDSITVVGHPMTGIDIDMNSISDTVQTLAVVALFAQGPTRVRGVAHNRFKETDRIGDLACELRKLGAEIEEHEDGLTIQPPTDAFSRSPDTFAGATLETYHDHRMAMSLSLAGLRWPGVRILDPACTSKTYPEFFADMESLLGRSHLWAS